MNCVLIDVCQGKSYILIRCEIMKCSANVSIKYTVIRRSRICNYKCLLCKGLSCVCHLRLQQAYCGREDSWTRVIFMAICLCLGCKEEMLGHVMHGSCS